MEPCLSEFHDNNAGLLMIIYNNVKIISFGLAVWGIIIVDDEVRFPALRVYTPIQQASLPAWIF